MDFSTYIQVGITSEKAFLVEQQYSAQQAGSGGLPVLATPWMIAFMENTAFNLVEERLPEGYTSVGVLVEVRHLAPTPLDRLVRVQVEITSIEGPKVYFDVQAWDEHEQIGSGRHQRIIIDQQRFLNRVRQKQIG